MDEQSIAIIGCVWFCICLVISYHNEDNLSDKVCTTFILFFALPVVIVVFLVVASFIFRMFMTALGM